MERKLDRDEPDHDALLRNRLLSLSEGDKDYWSFKSNSRREYGHGLFQYPAMMVPQVVEAVLEQVCSVHPDIERVGDPFVGSGTVMTESMMRGLAFTGTDINPLAILLCRVKSGPFFLDSLESRIEELTARIDKDPGCAIEACFPNRDKWFNRDVQIELSRIRRAIRAETTSWARRFFWVAMAETARTTSNSRTSTFKLHIRTKEDIEARPCAPVSTFKRVLARNLLRYKEQAKRLFEFGELQLGRYKRDITVTLGDARMLKSQVESDVIVTSPPYGDNTSTVPYGQYSYLPLQWIDLDDIDEGIGADYLATTHAIDARGLGGSRRVKREESEHVKDRSPTLVSYIESLNGQPSDRALRVEAFFRDLDRCLEPILRGLRPGGLMIWILGNRKVGGKRVPLDRVLADLLLAHQSKLLCQLTRGISSKRMAPKNNIADTMSTETILVMRKAM